MVDSNNYTVDTSVTGYTFVVTFDNDYIVSLPRNTKVEVKYTAILNKDAVIEGDGNINETYLKYGNKETDTKKTTTYTYSFNLKKTDKDGNELTGAEFKLYDKNNNEIAVVYDKETNTYRVAEAGETGETIKVGHAVIEGLDNDTYYLEEVVSPVGYNKLTSRVEFTVNKKESNKTYVRSEVTVKNYTGSQLPETGGIGTILFVTFGLTLVLEFGVLLVTKLRAYKENI